MDPRPALRARARTVGRGEDRSDRIRGEAAVEFASARRAQFGESPSFPVSGCSNLPMPEARSSGAMRSGRVAAEVDKTDHVEYACWSGVE